MGFWGFGVYNFMEDGSLFAKWGLLGAATYPLFKYGKIRYKKGPPILPEPKEKKQSFSNMPRRMRRTMRRRRRTRSRRRIFKRRAPRVKPDGLYKEKVTIVRDVVTDSSTGDAWMNIHWLRYTPAGFPLPNNNTFLDTNNEQFTNVAKLF